MARHNELGKVGEELAAQFLTNKGYEILEKNWRNKHKEIDIIAKQKKVIVFVEVKTHFPKEKAKNKNEELKNVIELILEKVDYFMQIYEDILKIKINNINNIQIMLLYDQNKLIDYIRVIANSNCISTALIEYKKI